MSFYLLQRHKRGHSVSADLHLTAVFKPDYMGSAEFEWGAFPKNISAMYEHLDSFIAEKTQVIDNHKPVDVYVFHSPVLLEKTKHLARFGDSSLIEEVKKLSKHGNFNLKGYPDFPGNRSGESGEFKTIAWTDIQHGVFITLDAITLDQFKSMIKRQISYQQQPRG